VFEWILDNDSLFRSVKQTTDGGYIYFGYKKQKNSLNVITNSYVILRKTDEQGIEEWYKTYNIDMGNYWVNGVKQTADGGYIMLGCTAMHHNNGLTDVFLLKLDSLGDSTWVRTYGGIANDWATGVMVMKDGGYLLSAETKSYGNVLGGKSDAWLIRTNSVGDTLWTRTHGAGMAESLSVQIQTNDGGYMLVGGTRSYGNGGSDVWLVKIDSMGYEDWSQTFGGSGNDGASSVQLTKDGGYIMIGYTTSFAYDGSDVWLIKTDANGQSNVSIPPAPLNGSKNRKLEMVVDLMGREVKITSNQILFYIYDDGSVDKKMIIE
jgi:hypothetical protein